MTTTVDIVRGVERVLNTAGIQPGVAVAYAPLTESGNRQQPMAYVIPDSLLSQRLARTGTNSKQRNVGVVLIRENEPGQTSITEQMLGYMDQIIDVLAQNPPVAEEGAVLAQPGDINADPMYSPEQLAKGVFVGTIIVEYNLA